MATPSTKPTKQPRGIRQWMGIIIAIVTLLSLGNNIRSSATVSKAFLSQRLSIWSFEGEETDNPRSKPIPAAAWDMKAHTRIDPTNLQKEYLSLRNVCIARSPSNSKQYQLLFFGNANGNGNSDVQGYAQQFAKEAIPYSDFQAKTFLTEDLQPPLTKAVVNITLPWSSLADLVADSKGSSNKLNITLLDGTTILAEPHIPDNMFHLYNDLILPIVLKLFQTTDYTGAPRPQRNEFKSPWRLYLTHGNNERYRNRAIAFDVLYKMFDEVLYSMETHLPDTSTFLCFERILWGGRRTMPYYTHPGRFGEHDKWKGVVPAFRDWIFELYGIRTTPRTIQEEERPKLTYIDRPCTYNKDRCLVDPDTFVDTLRQAFDVQTLRFDAQQPRDEQIRHTLALLANTDILFGMHGAGLAHMCYLPAHAMAVEMKSGMNRNSKLFLNMASLHEIPYYTFDTKAVSTRTHGTQLTKEHTNRLAADLLAAWKREVEYRTQKGYGNDRSSSNSSAPTRIGECLFPQYLHGVKLSSFDQSRCYLERHRSFNMTWMQCGDYHSCPWNPPH